jgi:uncharacterized protein DUF4384
MRQRLSCWILTGAAVVSAAASAPQPPPSGAKELFYSPLGSVVVQKESVSGAGKRPVEKPPTAAPRQPAPAAPLTAGVAPEPRNIGIHYWVELVTPGPQPGLRVTADRVFRSGERVRLHFRSNVSGYVALVQLDDNRPSAVLFPDAAKGYDDDRIEAFVERVLPGESAWFRFDDDPGTERVLVMFATRKESLPSLAGKTLPREVADACDQAVETARGGKGLVLETDTRSASDNGTYVVSIDGRPLLFLVTLEHA